MALKSLDERISEMRDEFVAQKITAMDETIALCESPIERAMLWAIVTHPSSQYVGSFLFGPGFHSFPGVDKEAQLPGVNLGDVCVFPQVPVKTDGGAYRLDLAMDLAFLMPDEREGRCFVNVECDGHDFHERTKEQAEHDKRRDRDLQLIGWRVVRFTGSEIFRDPAKAANEVLGFCARCANQMRGWA